MSVNVAQSEWADLVLGAQAGDGEAFTALFQQLHSPVLNYIFRIVGDRHAAEDITQEAFIRAHERIGQLGPPYDFKSWVFRIASNLAIDRLRRSKRFVDLEEPMDVLGPMTTKRPAEKKVQQSEARASVQDTLALMPTAYRQAIVLRELNGFSYEQVASALECTYDNARQMVHRARLSFRELHGLRMLATSGALQCRELGPLLSALHDGELSSEDRRAARKHIKSCVHCKETDEDLRKVAGIVAGLAPILPSPGWIENVLEKLRLQAPASPPGGAHPQGAGAGAAPAGGASSALGLGAKIAMGALAALIGGGVLVTVAAWAFSQLPAPSPPEADALAVERTVQAIIALTPIPPMMEPAEEPVVLPPSMPTSTQTQVSVELGPPIAIALVNSNCRAGPASLYPVLDYLLATQQTAIVGRDAQWNWWVVERLGHPGSCWVANSLTDEMGDTSQVPAIIAPPTPTPVDDQAPSISASHLPVNPLTNTPVTFEASASDPSGIALIEIYVRGPNEKVFTLVKSCSNGGSCSYTGGPYTVGNGEYYIRARDRAGNEAQGSTRSFTVTWYLG